MVAEGPCRVNDVADSTVVIEWPDNWLERVSTSQVVSEPKSRTMEEIKRAIRPTKDEKKHPGDYEVVTPETQDTQSEATKRINSIRP